MKINVIQYISINDAFKGDVVIGYADVVEDTEDCPFCLRPLFCW